MKSKSAARTVLAVAVGTAATVAFCAAVAWPFVAYYQAAGDDLLPASALLF